MTRYGTSLDNVFQTLPGAGDFDVRLSVGRVVRPCNVSIGTKNGKSLARRSLTPAFLECCVKLFFHASSLLF